MSSGAESMPATAPAGVEFDPERVFEHDHNGVILSGTITDITGPNGCSFIKGLPEADRMAVLEIESMSVEEYAAKILAEDARAAKNADLTATHKSSEAMARNKPDAKQEGVSAQVRAEPIIEKSSKAPAAQALTEAARHVLEVLAPVERLMDDPVQHEELIVHRTLVRAADMRRADSGLHGNFDIRAGDMDGRSAAEPISGDALSPEVSGTESLVLDTSSEQITDGTLVLVDPEAIINNDEALIDVHEFSVTTVETYAKLVAIDVASEALLVETDGEYGVELHDAPEPDDEGIKEILNQYLPTEAGTLQAIQENINEAPLEQAIAELSVYLSEAAEEPEAAEIRTLVHEIRSLLAANVHIHEEDSSHERLNLELTDKLLALLRELGYDNPGEVLVAFVSAYGTDKLLQAVQYLWGFDLEGARYERVRAPMVAAVMHDDAGARIRAFGHVLLALVSAVAVSESATA